MILEVYGPTLASGGLAFMMSLMIGYFIKKLLKLIAVVLGFILTVIAYLAYEKIISVDWSELQLTSQQITSNAAFVLLSTINGGLAEISLGTFGGATAGFILGLLKG
jgi:uncharacterized membrane protein (Fun14 family)